MFPPPPNVSSTCILDTCCLNAKLMSSLKYFLVITPRKVDFLFVTENPPFTSHKDLSAVPSVYSLSLYPWTSLLLAIPVDPSGFSSPFPKNAHALCSERSCAQVRMEQLLKSVAQPLCVLDYLQVSPGHGLNVTGLCTPQLFRAALFP